MNTDIDTLTLHRKSIENPFTSLMWHESVARRIGLRGMSQVWVDEPSWYLWSSEDPGGYLVRFIAEESMPGDLLYGSYLVHHFPAPGPVRQACTAEEISLLRDTDRFDPVTVTPHFASYGSFLDRFIVGEIGTVIDASGAIRMFVCAEGPDGAERFSPAVNLVVSAWNFHARTHHGTLHRVAGCDGPAPLLVSYDEEVRERFCRAFGIDAAAVHPEEEGTASARWRMAAHDDAPCSAQGACGCTHE